MNSYVLIVGSNNIKLLIKDNSKDNNFYHKWEKLSILLTENIFNIYDNQSIKMSFIIIKTDLTYIHE